MSNDYEKPSYGAEIYGELCTISGLLEQIRDIFLDLKDKEEGILKDE